MEVKVKFVRWNTLSGEIEFENYTKMLEDNLKAYLKKQNYTHIGDNCYKAIDKQYTKIVTIL